MDGIFDNLLKTFLSMQNSLANSYEERKVDYYQCNTFIVDTVLIVDNPEAPYETAVKHVDFNRGRWCILQHYKTKEKAQVGHDKWVDDFKNDRIQVIKEEALIYSKICPRIYVKTIRG